MAIAAFITAKGYEETVSCVRQRMHDKRLTTYD
jgi:hypothetical protein